jgi:hypothetical protein
MTDEDWQALVAWMHSPEVQAVVARYAEPEAEEPGEPEQAMEAI